MWCCGMPDVRRRYTKELWTNEETGATFANPGGANPPWPTMGGLDDADWINIEEVAVARRAAVLASAKLENLDDVAAMRKALNSLARALRDREEAEADRRWTLDQATARAHGAIRRLGRELAAVSDTEGVYAAGIRDRIEDQRWVIEACEFGYDGWPRWFISGKGRVHRLPTCAAGSSEVIEVTYDEPTPDIACRHCSGGE